MSRRLAIATYVLTAIFFALFFLYPIAITLKEAFVPDGKFSLEYFGHIFSDRIYLEGLRNAFALAVMNMRALLATPDRISAAPVLQADRRDALQSCGRIR